MSNVQIQSRAKRFSYMRDVLGISPKELASTLKISTQLVYNLQSGTKPISLKLIEKIYKTFGISSDWLLWGIGDPYVASSSNLAEEQGHFYASRVGEGGRDIAVVDLRAAAAYPSHYQEEDYWADLPTLQLPFAELRGRDQVVVQIDGNSMEETIQHLDYLVCEKVSEGEALNRGQIYVMVQAEGITCQRLQHEQKEQITWGSDNPEYGTVMTTRQELIQLWRVRYKISSNLRRIEPMTPIRDLLGQMNKIDLKLDYMSQYLRHKNG